MLLDLQGFLIPTAAAATSSSDSSEDDEEGPPPPRWASAVRMHLGRRAAMEGATEQREALTAAIAEVVGYLPAGANDPGPTHLSAARSRSRRSLFIGLGMSGSSRHFARAPPPAPLPPALAADIADSDPDGGAGETPVRIRAEQA